MCENLYKLEMNEKPQKKHWFNAIEDWFEKVLKKILKLRYSPVE
jgi:hypothetical protein